MTQHPEFPGVAWQKSSYSGNQGNCVEIGEFEGGYVIRNSRQPQGQVLRFTPAEMAAFVDGVKDGEFDVK